MQTTPGVALLPRRVQGEEKVKSKQITMGLACPEKEGRPKRKARNTTYFAWFGTAAKPKYTASESIILKDATENVVFEARKRGKKE